MTDIFTNLPRQTQTELMRLAQLVTDVKPVDVASWELDAAMLHDTSLIAATINKVASWAGLCKGCLYYFHCDGASVNLAEVEKVFLQAKAITDNPRAYPRYNRQAICLYVGSSQTVAKRFREHLGYGARKTYALQLAHWAPALPLKLTFVCAKYPDNTPSEVIQALEDTLWQKFGPMFGRQGRK